MRSTLLTVVQLAGLGALLYGLYLLAGLPWLLIVGGAVGTGLAVIFEAAEAPPGDRSALDVRDGV